MNLIPLVLAVMFVVLALSCRFSIRWRGLSFLFSTLAFGSAAMAYPPAFITLGGLELKRVITPLVQVILFGMGMTLTIADFKRVLTMPRGIVICCLLHYTIMPLGGFLFGRIFGLEGAIATGLVLIGSVPSGTSSNVITLLARGNVPLSVTVTAVSTLISPFVTPFAMKWLAGTYVPIDAIAMMFSILKLVIAPLVLGLLVHRFLPSLATRLVRVLPFIAMLAICIVVSVTIALSHDQLLKVGLALFAAAACHNATGYLLGYWGGRLAGLNKVDSRTTAFEVGMQNGGMATGLAFGVLNSPLAALASAVFGPWSVVTSSVLASWWGRRAAPEQSPPDESRPIPLISSDSKGPVRP